MMPFPDGRRPSVVSRARARTRKRTGRHRRALTVMIGSGIPFLLGGGYALREYAGGVRATRDLDVFVRRRDARPLLDAMAAAGFATELLFPHWLGKARTEGESIDIIFSSGNGIAEVDDEWFEHGTPARVLGLEVTLSPPEEMIWSKAFVMERERYDGADIAHLIRRCHARLDWRRLLRRFGRHWRVLMSHLTLFGFIYPGDRRCVPPEVMLELIRRLEAEFREPADPDRVCQGTLLSREQYLTDVSRWGYVDARLEPHGSLTPEDVAHWTAAINDQKK